VSEEPRQTHTVGHQESIPDETPRAATDMEDPQYQYTSEAQLDGNAPNELRAFDRTLKALDKTLKAAYVKLKAAYDKLKAVYVKLKAVQFRISRRLLFSWIKPTFLGGEPTALNLSENDLVCYVLPFRSLADLLVTDMACERGGLPATTQPMPELGENRSFFFMGHPEGTLGRKTLRQQSERMARLVEQQAGTLEKNIKVVPVSIFWGHQPDREKSVFKLFLSEHWSATSGIKKFFAGLFHPSHILVQFGTPICLNEMMADDAEPERQRRKLLRLLRVHFNNQRQAIIGPDLSHRRTLLNTILESDDVRAAVTREAESKKISEANVEKKALGYAHEIASDQSYRVIRFFDVLLTWLWNNLYGGIEVNGIEHVKEMAQSHEIIYVPCHRSHIDYLLLSYVLYHNGLTPPHIAAGKNLNLPLIGPLLRRAGAFFMRRSFQGDTLYKEVFDEYLHQMFTKGYSVEYFIEGGRSRTGRTINPRTGMLRMTVRSFQKDSTKPIAFMPVYFGYERVLESTSYRAELSGKDKKSESVLDVFKILPSLKREFGQVTVNFGEPVKLREFLDDAQPGWSETGGLPPQKFGDVCVTLGDRLVTEINRAVAVKPTNLIAIALLSTARQNIEEDHLLNQVALLRSLAEDCAANGASITDLPAEAILDQAIQIMGLSRQTHQFGTIISASPEQSIFLTYNANNVLHVFAIPSLIARFVRTRRRTQFNEVLGFLEALYPYLKAEMFLCWDEKELEQRLTQVVESLLRLGVIVRDGDALTTPAPESREYNYLQDVSSITDATLERFYIVLALIKSEPGGTTRHLESTAAGIAEQLSVLYGINSPDFFDQSLFRTFLSTLKRRSIITQQLEVKDSLSELEYATARTLDPDVRFNILQAVNHANR